MNFALGRIKAWSAAALLLVGMGSIPALAQSQAADASFPQKAALFAYDSAAPFDLRVVSTERRGTVTVSDITFSGMPGVSTVKAYLVTPDGVGPSAAILWLHWLGESAANRGEFLDEAVALASKGAVSLLINAMWSRPHWYEKRNLDKDYASSIQQVIEIRRAMDLLLAQPGVDKARLGLVGHDYGGMYGALAAGADQRTKATVLLAVNPSLENWAFFSGQPSSMADYHRQMSALDIPLFLGQVKGGILLQFSNKDPFVSQAEATAIFDAAPQAKEAKRYDTGHDMEGAAVMADRDAWLQARLGLSN